MATIAFIVGDSGALDANRDTPFKNRLESTLGHTVTVIDDDDAETTDYSSYDAIVITDTSAAANTDGLKTEEKPILTTLRYLNSGFSLGTGNNYYATATQINIVDNSHYITENESTGNLTVYSAAHNIASMNGWSNDVNDLAQEPGDATEATILEIDKDETLVDSSTAAERRVFFGGFRGEKLNSDGWDLFDRSIGWCLYEDAGAETYTKTYSIDVLLKKLDITKTYTMDVLLKKADITKTYTSDTLLKKMDITKTYTIDVILQAITAGTKTYTVDVILLAELIKTYTVDVILYAAFDPVSIILNVLDSNWNTDNVAKPSIRSVVSRQRETGTVKRWNYLMQGDLIRIYEKGFAKVPMSAGYDYATTTISLRIDIGTCQGRSHLFDVFDEARRILHEQRGSPDATHTSWRPLKIIGRELHHDKQRKLWRLIIDIELVQKCYALA